MPKVLFVRLWSRCHLLHRGCLSSPEEPLRSQLHGYQQVGDLRSPNIAEVNRLLVELTRAKHEHNYARAHFVERKLKEQHHVKVSEHDKDTVQDTEARQFSGTWRVMGRAEEASHQIPAAGPGPGRVPLAGVCR